MIYPRLRSLFFRLDPEQIHALIINLLHIVGGVQPLRKLLCKLYKVPNDPIQVFGLQFPNRLGLAAGYDKDALGWRGLCCFGFGHIELGTVTPKPQAGNPKKRLFRIPEQCALLNRMGFPGRGMEFFIKQLNRTPDDNLVLGINIGKNKDTPIEEAIQDYLFLMRGLYPYADYLAINISSPNTEGLRNLQSEKLIDDFLGQLSEERHNLGKDTGLKVPLLVKLAPDLSDQELDGALDAILRHGIDGVIATNTTIKKDLLPTSWQSEAGGVSGAPLTELSTIMISKISRRTNAELPIIGVGGVMSGEDARKKIEAGASLVQIYTGLVYQGPRLIKEIINETKFLS